MELTEFEYNKQELLRLMQILKKGNPTILWLDDERDPNGTYPSTFGYEPGEYRPTWVEGIIGKRNPGDWNVVWVTSYEEFTKYLRENPIPDIVCFDHDLGEQRTGKDAANELVDILALEGTLGPVVRSQSSNPAGAANIIGLFMNWWKHCKFVQLEEMK